MKIAIINANGSPINGETTLSIHMAKSLMSKGHNVDIIMVDDQYRNNFPNDIKTKFVELNRLNVKNYDRVVLNSVPYMKPKSIMFRLTKKLGDYTFIMHERNNIFKMFYLDYAERSKRCFTNDRQLLRVFPNADFFKTIFYYDELPEPTGSLFSKEILIPTRLTPNKNPAKIRSLIKNNRSFDFFLCAGDMGDINGLLKKHKFGSLDTLFFKKFDNKNRDKAFKNKYAIVDMSNHVSGRDNLNYTMLEAMYYGVAPIFDTTYTHDELYGFDVAKKEKLKPVTTLMYNNIIKKNREILKEYNYNCEVFINYK